LRISEQKYRELVENANSIILRVDPDWNITFINNFARNFFGYTQEELLGKNVVGTIVPWAESTGRDLADMINKIARNPENFRYNENENMCKNRDRVWIAWTNRVITDRKGDVTEILCIGNDITEKKKAEKLLNTRLKYEEGLAACSHDLLADIPDALTKAINHLLRASDTSRVYIFENFEDINDGLCVRQTHEASASGVSPEKDNPILQHISYKDGFERWQKILSAGEPISGEVASFPADEKEILESQGILSILLLPIKVNGIWYGFIGFDDTIRLRNWRTEDIQLLVTASEMIGSYIEREKARTALKELEHIINQSSVTVFLWGAETHLPVEFVSDNIRQFGYSPEDFYIRSGLFSNIIHSEDSKRVSEEVSRYIAGGHTKFSQEYRILNAQGETRWIERQMWIRRNERGVITHYQGIVTDITSRKQMQKDLEEAREKAEAANRAKSEFLANMSHEIRTPMNAILGFSEILINLVKDTEQKNYLVNILSGGKSLLSLIDDILDLSKIEAGKLEIQPEPISIRNIIHEINQLFQYKFQEKNIEFISEAEKDVPELMLLDEVRIRQILVNLVGNAIKFTHEGYVKIRIRGEGLPLTTLIIEVEDTGIGIPEEQQEIIFETFRQQDGQMTRKYGGTGLGLTITKRLTEIMNGKISVESEVGRGSIFKITLNNVKEADNRDIAGISSQDDHVHVEFGPATVLIVDDIDFNRILVKGLLKDEPFNFTEAENGEQALAILGLAEEVQDIGSSLRLEATTEKLPDLILMDLRMPGKNGYEVTEIIKKNDRLKNIPVIALTASAMKETEEKIRHLFDGYIRKPFNSDELTTELKKYLPYTFKDSNKNRLHAPCALHPATCNIHLHSPEAATRLPDLIQILENELIPKWKDIKDTLIFDEVREFAENADSRGIKYDCRILRNWSEVVINQMQNFDMESLERTFQKFPEIINKLKH